jgi:superkiller protein 3
MLSEAAESAARQARFSPAKLSLNPAKIYGVINYTFTIPSPKSVPVPSPASREVDTVKPNEETSDSKPVKQSEGSLEVNPKPATVPPETSTSFYQEGLKFLAAGQPLEAVEPLKQAIRLDPNDPAAYTKLGSAYAALEQYKEAVTVLTMATTIKPDAEAYSRLGYAYTNLKKYNDALKAFKQALEVTRNQAMSVNGEKTSGFPTIEDIHYNLGLGYQNVGRYDEAIKELKKVIALNPKRDVAYYALGLAYFALGDVEAAKKNQKTLNSLNPELAKKLNAAFSANPMLLRPGCSTFASCIGVN